MTRPPAKLHGCEVTANSDRLHEIRVRFLLARERLTGNVDLSDEIPDMPLEPVRLQAGYRIVAGVLGTTLLEVPTYERVPIRLSNGRAQWIEIDFLRKGDVIIGHGRVRNVEAFG